MAVYDGLPTGWEIETYTCDTEAEAYAKLNEIRENIDPSVKRISQATIHFLVELGKFILLIIYGIPLP